MATENRLHHVRAGSGEPLVLLHPLGAELIVWEPVIPLLAAERDVVALDLPGFGQSPPLPQHIAHTPRALADAAARFLDTLGIGRAHVVGNSLGGWIALELARAGRALSVATCRPPASGRGRSAHGLGRIFAPSGDCSCRCSSRSLGPSADGAGYCGHRSAIPSGYRQAPRHGSCALT